jgi:phage tail sheath protein FI
MPALRRPGVFLEERPPLIIPPAGTLGASAGALVGAATRGPTTPTRVTSYAEFTKLFGDVSPTSGELAYHAYAAFANGVGSLYVSRVAGAGAAAATRSLTDRAGTPQGTLVVNAANPGAWGNDIYIDISDTAGTTGQFDLTVYFGGTTNAFVVERFTGLSMSTTDSRYALSVVNNTVTGSRYVVLAQPTTPSATAAPNNNPAVQLGTRLTNGTNGAAVVDADFSTALALLDNVQEAFNLGLPGATVGQQNLAITYAQNRGDVFVVAELPTTTALTSAAAITAGTALLASSYGAVYWPNLIVADPSSTAPGATRVQTPTGALLGLIALTDATRGIQKAPAGTTSRIAGALAPQVQLTSTDLDNLNVAQVNAIRQIPGSGIVVMGARTLKPGSSDRYVPIRRVLNYVKKNVINLTQFAVFEPNTTQTRQMVESVLEDFLRDCWHRGMLKGAAPQQAYYIVCDASNNTATSISQGLVNVEIGVSLVTPAEFIVISIGQFEGGAAVTGG